LHLLFLCYVMRFLAYVLLFSALSVVTQIDQHCRCRYLSPFLLSSSAFLFSRLRLSLYHGPHVMIASVLPHNVYISFSSSSCMKSSMQLDQSVPPLGLDGEYQNVPRSGDQT
ncbi:hypothetical protein PMAYCL1PPCAC_00915, partial [Pristionchus mayeri]